MEIDIQARKREFFGFLDEKEGEGTVPRWREADKKYIVRAICEKDPTRENLFSQKLIHMKIKTTIID